MSTISGRSRRKRSLDEEVNKCLKDNFKNWTEAMTDLTLVESMSLRERIHNDKRRLKDGSLKEPMGKFYYENLRQVYGASMDPAMKLKIKDASLPEDPQLFAALKGVMQHCRDYSPANALLQTYGKFDQQNLVALLKCTLKVSPLTSMESLSFVLNVMRYLSRHSYGATHPDEVNCLFGHFDAALSRSLNLWRNNERPVSEWWHTNKSFAKLVLDEAKVERVLQTDCLGNILGDLKAVVESCDTGRKMFTRALTEAQFALVDAKLTGVIEALSGKNLTEAIVNASREAFSKEVIALGKTMAETFTAEGEELLLLGHEFQHAGPQHHR